MIEHNIRPVQIVVKLPNIVTILEYIFNKLDWIV
jgi:hypothetical protein